MNEENKEVEAEELAQENSEDETNETETKSASKEASAEDAATASGDTEEAAAEESAIEAGTEAEKEQSLEEDEDEEDEEEEEPEEEEEEEEDEVEYKTPADKLFFKTLKRNAPRREAKLRKHLAAPIEFRLKDSLAAYVVDWSKEELVVSSEPAKDPVCSIELSEQHLLEIAAGQLNPQVAMLSEKIGIKGDKATAMYAFNLFVRRGRR